MLRDAAAPVYERFMLTTLRRLGTADMARLVQTHRQNPFGPHPDELARVLNVFRAAETEGKYVIVRLRGEEGWRLAKVTGRRRDGSVAIASAPVGAGISAIRTVSAIVSCCICLTRPRRRSTSG